MKRVPNAYWWQRKHLRQAMRGFWRNLFWIGSIRPTPLFVDPLNTYVDPAVEIGEGTVVEPNVWIMGQTKIGKNCLIGFGSIIIGSVIGDDVIVDGARIEEKSTVEHHAEIGYTAQLKRTYFGAYSKMLHHGYLGDAKIGQNVNIGAGVITANYDGERKHETVIEDNAFIGTNVCLVAPIRIPQGAMIAAGSTVTGKDKLEPWQLFIARPPGRLSCSKRVVKDHRGWHLEELKEDQQ